MSARKVLGVVTTADPSPSHFDASSSLRELADQVKHDAQVKLLVDPTFEGFRAAVLEFQPSLIYICGSTNYGQNPTHGTIGPVSFADGQPPVDALASACAGVETVYLDAEFSENIGNKLQQQGVQHAIVWPEGTNVPALVAAQFSHTLFCGLLTLKATVHESFALANHVVQAHLTATVDGQHLAPALPSLYSALKAILPDNSSIPPPSIPGVDISQGLAQAVPGWADIRLLAPRAELRLLLTGQTSLIDSSKLSFLGEALRALLVMEMRNLTLVSTSPCPKTPANLPPGCSALRCTVKTASGADVVAILGGQPAVLQNNALVEHALRMTLVADSLSLQFRLPPPGVPPPMSRSSAAIAGNVPVVDSLVLSSVWAVQVLRCLSLQPGYKPLISLGVAAVGGTATAGVSAVDSQRMRMVVHGQGPAHQPLHPVQMPGTAVKAEEVPGPSVPMPPPMPPPAPM